MRSASAAGAATSVGPPAAVDRLRGVSEPSRVVEAYGGLHKHAGSFSEWKLGASLGERECGRVLVRAEEGASKRFRGRVGELSMSGERVELGSLLVRGCAGDHLVPHGRRPHTAYRCPPHHPCLTGLGAWDEAVVAKDVSKRWLHAIAEGVERRCDVAAIESIT